ncbi:hypothetical protein AB0D10_38190 [Kitasatospora sp. NPDC048545]|uniref:hypothetical protein n=1 Tax=Kitasatospora sp. NPDC048545 TaxID=3157208 RepID=UPI00340DDF6A
MAVVRWQVQGIKDISERRDQPGGRSQRHKVRSQVVAANLIDAEVPQGLCLGLGEQTTAVILGEVDRPCPEGCGRWDRLGGHQATVPALWAARVIYDTPEDATAAALQWAGALAEAARERAEHQRLRQQMALVTAQLADSRANAEAMLEQLGQAGRQVEAVTRLWVENAGLRSKVRDLTGEIQAAVATAQEAHRLAESARTVVQETLQAAGSISAGFEELEAWRKALAAEWRALEMARAQAPAGPDSGRAPVRAPVPAEARSWRRP